MIGGIVHGLNEFGLLVTWGQLNPYARLPDGTPLEVVFSIVAVLRAHHERVALGRDAFDHAAVVMSETSAAGVQMTDMHAAAVAQSILQSVSAGLTDSEIVGLVTSGIDAAGMQTSESDAARVSVSSNADGEMSALDLALAGTMREKKERTS